MCFEIVRELAPDEISYFNDVIKKTTESKFAAMSASSIERTPEQILSAAMAFHNTTYKYLSQQISLDPSKIWNEYSSF